LATRIYLPSTGAAAVTPATWAFPNQDAITLAGVTTRINSAFAKRTTTLVGGTGQFKALYRYVVGPLAAQSIGGTVDSLICGQESATNADATYAAAVKIITAAGADRAVLLAPTASDSVTSTYEFSTPAVGAAYLSRYLYDASEVRPVAINTQSCQDGDYLVIEIGFRANGANTRTCSLQVGDSGADLSARDQLEGANPWIEFSADLLFEGQGGESYTGTSTVTGTATNSAAGIKRGKGTAAIIGNAEVTIGVPIGSGLFAQSHTQYADESWEFAEPEVFYGSATVTGTANLNPIGYKAAALNPSVTGTADLSLATHRVNTSSISISGTSAVSATVKKSVSKTVTVSGSSTVADTGYKAITKTATVTGTAQVSVASFPVFADKVDVTITGDAALSLSVYKSVSKTATVTGTATNAATGIKRGIVNPSVTGTAAVVATVKTTRKDVATIEGTAAVSVEYIKTEILPGVGDPRVTGTAAVAVAVKKIAYGLPATTGTAAVAIVVKTARATIASVSGTASVVCSGYRAILPPGVISVVGDAQVSATGIHVGIANLDIRGDPLITGVGSKTTSRTVMVVGSAAVTVLGYNPAQAIRAIHLEFTATPATIEFTAVPVTVTLTNI